MQFFVKTIGHYPAHIKWGKNGQGSFQERSFCKALTSKTSRKFLKKFVKTQMFSLFIQEAERNKKSVEGKTGISESILPLNSPYKYSLDMRTHISGLINWEFRLSHNHNT